MYALFYCSAQARSVTGIIWYKGLFNGWLPASTKMIPQAGISFVVYEMVKRRLDQSNYVDVEADEDIFD